MVAVSDRRIGVKDAPFGGYAGQNRPRGISHSKITSPRLGRATRCPFMRRSRPDIPPKSTVGTIEAIVRSMRTGRRLAKVTPQFFVATLGHFPSNPGTV